MPQPIPILGTIIAAAIRQRRVLSLIYSRALEPQLFAPVALYVSASDRLMLEGYEVKGGTLRWREAELTAVRDVRQTLLTFDLDSETPIRKQYPSGATVIAQALTRVLIAPSNAARFCCLDL